MSMLIEVWGDYACFSRPEMKTERVSYDIMTPSAARGLVEAIYWHPGMKYHIDRCATVRSQRSTSKVRTAIGSRTAAETGNSAHCDAETNLRHPCRCRTPGQRSE